MSQLMKKILLMETYFTAKFQSIDAHFESSCDCPVHDGIDAIISVWKPKFEEANLPVSPTKPCQFYHLDQNAGAL